MRTILKTLFIFTLAWLFAGAVNAETSIGGFVQTWLTASEGNDKKLDDFEL